MRPVPIGRRCNGASRRFRSSARRAASSPITSAGPHCPRRSIACATSTGCLQMLAGLTATLALIAVANALVSAVRRHRHEFAPQGHRLRPWSGARNGGVPRVGSHARRPRHRRPSGVLVGRVAWSIVADNIGIGANAVLPVLALALLIPATLLLVNLIAFGPHTRPHALDRRSRSPPSSAGQATIQESPSSASAAALTPGMCYDVVHEVRWDPRA